MLVTVEYRVAPERAAQFLATLRAFAHERLRDGAYLWGVFEDVAEHGRHIEHFLVPSWLEHGRQHRRVSLADADLQGRVREFHLGPVAPHVQHYVAPAVEP